MTDVIPGESTPMCQKNGDGLRGSVENGESVGTPTPQASTASSDSTYHHARQERPLKQLNRIAKRPPLDLEFQDLHYAVRDGRAKGGWRPLLKSVNGIFRSGELTAIMGPSGAGKSTLLNILAGYVTAGVKGSIKINDRPRNMKVFHKLSSYIQQEDIVQPHLSVHEAMVFAATVKLGAHIEKEEKLAVVNEVIDLLGLQRATHTRSEYLSGGERKRLTVGLELVNNPPVIFLDEPTTGLDNFAINQCVELLQKISKMGRTVICTIHQPPASLFQTFDQVYILAEGLCVYNGSPSQLVPFLSMSGCACPQNNTPADYIIEIVQGQSENVKCLSSVTQNGKINMRDPATNQSHAKKPPPLEYQDSFDNIIINDDNNVYNETTTPHNKRASIKNSDIVFPTSFWVQFSMLVHRMFLQMCRNKSILYIQVLHHILSAILIGGIFLGIGNNASQTIAVFKYCVVCNVFFMYTYVMSPVLLFPLEMQLMKREYFNRWYSLKAFYCAMTITTLPLLMILGTAFCTIAYFMAAQPLDVYRYVNFVLMGLMVGLCSQGLGYAIGANNSITSGSIVGPSILTPLMALAVYGMGYKDTIEPFMSFLMSLSYLRFGVVGLCNAIFYKRGPLECTDDVYCHYARPEVLMQDMGMPITDYKHQLGAVAVFMLGFRVVCYLSLKYRLNAEISRKIVNVAHKIIRRKH